MKWKIIDEVLVCRLGPTSMFVLRTKSNTEQVVMVMSSLAWSTTMSGILSMTFALSLSDSSSSESSSVLILESTLLSCRCSLASHFYWRTYICGSSVSVLRCNFSSLASFASMEIASRISDSALCRLVHDCASEISLHSPFLPVKVIERGGRTWNDKSFSL